MFTHVKKFQWEKSLLVTLNSKGNSGYDTLNTVTNPLFYSSSGNTCNTLLDQKQRKPYKEQDDESKIDLNLI